MEKTKVIALSVVIALFATGVVHAYTNSSTIQGQVVVPSACIATLNSSSVVFGSVTPGSNTGAANQAVSVLNNGNTQATNTTITGTTWSDGGVNSMAVGQTQYGVSGFTYGAGTALTTSPVSLTGGNLAAGGSLAVYFGVGIPVQQAAATYNQTITVSMNC